MTRAQSIPRIPRRGNGWERIVERLHQAQDNAVFMSGMLQIQCMIVAADYGAIWTVDEQNNVSLTESWPTTLAEHGPDSAVLNMLQEAAHASVGKSTSQILKLQIGEDNEETPNSLVFVTVMRCKGRIAAVTTAVSESRDTRIARVTQPMRELAAGLFESFQAKQEARAHHNDAQNVRRAMALLAVSQEGRGWHGACLNLVNELARQQQCSRVSLGWVKGQTVRIVAMSDTEHLKRHDKHVRLTEMSMSECLDQQQPVVYPVPEDTEPLLAQAVVHAHRRLTSDHPNQHALSIPLRHGDEWSGVLTLERPNSPFDPELIRQLQLIADVMAPQLHDRRHGNRFLVVHAWHSFSDALSYLVGPKHVAWKLCALLFLGVLAFGIFGTWPYYVTAPFTLDASDKRIIPSPYDGTLDNVSTEPGASVQAGQLLAQLDVTELRLQLAEATSEFKRSSLEKSQATAENKQAEAQQAQAQMNQARSRMELLQYHIDRASVRTPINGIVLSGYWHDKVGGVIDQGKPMFEIASMDNPLALVRISEDDIDLVDSQKIKSGHLATRSVPEKKFSFQIDRIVPLATPVDGENVFEIRCHIDNPASWLRPGMEGLARIDIGRRRIIWIATRRVINKIRLWLWL